MKKVTCPDTRKLPEIAQVEWVRHFTRFAQRRLGWGDAQTTTKEVAKAVHEENTEELLAIMPEARPLVLCGELQHLPALHDALRSGEPAALTDCRHQFLTENMSTPPVLGPCGACGKEQRSTYKQGFTGCAKCGLVQCKPCAFNAMACRSIECFASIRDAVALTVSSLLAQYSSVSNAMRDFMALSSSLVR